MYIVITLNHIRAVKGWAEANGGQANLDLLTFELEVKARNRFYRLYPQFQAKIDDHLVHVGVFNDNSRGFIGWLPYRPLSWPMASDKLLFKSALSSSGLLTPQWWKPETPAPHDYILKKSYGSFGYDIRGPYTAATRTDPALVNELMARSKSGEVFAEQFIKGRIVKAWFWGESPFHLQVHKFPEVVGDGESTIQALVAERLEAAGLMYESYRELSFVRTSLASQGLNLDSVLTPGQAAWIDFRYGRQFSAEATQSTNDDALASVAPATREQIHQLGKHLAAHLAKEFPAPVQYSVDGVMDDKGNIWWLEMNSNPIFPPTGYARMLNTLFGIPEPLSKPPELAPRPGIGLGNGMERPAVATVPAAMRHSQAISG